MAPQDTRPIRCTEEQPYARANYTVGPIIETLVTRGQRNKLSVIDSQTDYAGV